ncbi:MAG: glycosyltransferase, partial [Bacteroidota bacterium]|nr:glycosyltransferase [Bacteroidota bacterium]
MWWFLLLPFCFCLIYCLLIVQYRKWFVKLSLFKAELSAQYTHFSIIIPARNEEENIEACLQSIFQNNYPSNRFEVLVIDDFSSDRTVEQIKHLQKKHSNLRLFLLQDLLGDNNINSYKKKAIELAIGKAAGDWIITTDADCVVPQQWLFLFNAYINQNKPVFIAAPVSFIQQHTFVSRFQSLDFMSLQGITAASVAAGFHSMCNGANLAYEKSAFYKVNGFAGIDNIASGDDMLLMHKIAQQFPNGIGSLFHQNAIVQTQPVDS